ncbi:MAG: alkaline phosphatase [Sedimentisphaerales bacterium]|nr:alkaline phosphatase [Sedimentisphaerales bacterium]
MRNTVATVTIALLVLLGVAAAGAARAAATSNDYPKPAAMSGDLSFYRAPITTESYPLTRARRVRNVIFCIGDGMGANQVALARLKAVGAEGKLHMEKMPVGGLVRTHSNDSLVTDSAASGTALATGIKTNNGMIGMAPDEQPYGTILELARADGMATGLVATSAITHATPASFAAHVTSRKMETTIAEHLIANRINVLFGGGRKFFLPKGAPDSARKDDRDLIAEAKEAGYTYIETTAELRAVRHRHLLGLFQPEALTTEAPEPSLELLTKKAIGALRRANVGSAGRRKGFFLMVEGSQIDWACHDNDADNMIRQTLLFDQAVAAAVDFARKDGRTLVIVAADHETGGLTFTAADKEGAGPKVHWSTKGHSGAPVPIYAFGPNAETFAGVYDNTEIPRKIARLLDLGPFPRPKK